ncbi:permease [Phenylobacterium sp.]|uniref:permease n=1 Tax=Phenylobacterium sp. TaxID=1871053 RepID=UPI002F402A82
MTEARTLPAAPRLLLFFALAAAGLLYVKWLPYWDKAFVAASTHSIGGSILMGKAAQAPAASWDAAWGYALAYGKAIWKAMVLGLLLGSGVQALLPADWVARLLGRARFGSALAGGLLALPGMMCTCCAAPVVVGLRRQQASAGGAMAFWLGNSVLNPATLVFIGFVLGWKWTALRLVLGVAMVFGLGWLANRLTSPGEAQEAEAAAAALAGAPQAAPLRRWLTILGRMSLRLIPEYVVLVLLLGAGRAWLFPTIGPAIGDHIQWIVAFALAGALFVIPTAGEVPIIQAMLSLGIGAGPAGALLMTLPPISLPSMAMLSRSFPPRILAAVAAGVVAFGLLAGLSALALGF